MKGGYSRKSVLTGITSFSIVLFTMPLGHALTRFLWSMCSHPQLFTMRLSRWGAVGLVMVIIGVFAKEITTDIMGIIRRTTLLDRMGRVYLRILCTSL